MSADKTIAEASPAACAAAAGWLAARVRDLLGDRTYLDRVIFAAIRSQIDFRFLVKLDAEVRDSCRARRVRPPRLEDFFRGRG